MFGLSCAMRRLTTAPSVDTERWERCPRASSRPAFRVPLVCCHVLTLCVPLLVLVVGVASQADGDGGDG